MAVRRRNLVDRVAPLNLTADWTLGNPAATERPPEHPTELTEMDQIFAHENSKAPPDRHQKADEAGRGVAGDLDDVHPIEYDRKREGTRKTKRRLKAA
jgi:hypothetical protein